MNGSNIFEVIGAGLILAGFFILLPIYLYSKAKKKGQKGWAAATIITMFIGYGWLVGLIALTRPFRREITLLEKCPFCGNDKGIVESGTVDKKTGRQISSLLGVIGWGLLSILVIGFPLWMAISTWIEGDRGAIRWTYGPTLAGIGILSIAIVFGRFPIQKVLQYLRADRVITDVFRCNSCKKKWSAYYHHSESVRA